MKNIKRSTLTVIILILLTLTFSANTLADAVPLIDVEQLPYKYEFAQKYIVAGERVLNLTITNNTSHNIEALEFEARLLDAFGDVISDWSIFSNPDLKISTGDSASLTLTLSRKNILGVNIENVLDKARSFELRYTRILLSNGTIVRKADLYPNLQKTYGQYHIDLKILNGIEIEDKTNYNFTRVGFATDSNIYKFIKELPYNKQDQYINIDTLDELMDLFSEDGIVVLLKATNISEEVAKKNWQSSLNPPLMILDDAMNQYSQFALMYSPQLMSNLTYNGEHLPGVTLTMVYVFDKFDGHDPEEIEVYIDGQKYIETFKLR